jgi:RNase H-fold protein (predicted Holliday junction resolvase)
MPDADRPVLAIDPGRGKCGLAVVFASGEVAEQAVVPRAGFEGAVRDMAARHRPVAVVIGNRTGSAACRRELEPSVDVPIVVVEEHETTLRARDRYFRDHPPRGWRRLVPLGLITPPRPIDDYAAVLLGDAYWKGAHR